ncbi:MAG: GFA family protein [Halioglobus sp.]|nr:GFA family protein [Halioglobus sp.]
MYRGSCLCQAVRYEIRGDLTAVGHCHCSKCRKVSGTGSNAVAYASPDHLVWTAGADLVRTFAFDDGWSSTFCSNCGSPLPQCDPAGAICYVPAGTLDDDPGPDIMGHIYVGSMASWDRIGDDAPRYDENIPG